MRNRTTRWLAESVILIVSRTITAMERVVKALHQVNLWLAEKWLPETLAEAKAEQAIDAWITDHMLTMLKIRLDYARNHPDAGDDVTLKDLYLAYPQQLIDLGEHLEYLDGCTIPRPTFKKVEEP